MLNDAVQKEKGEPPKRLVWQAGKGEKENVEEIFHVYLSVKQLT